MTTEKRNDIFTQYQNVIWWVINKNRRLFSALHMEDDDVFQDLSIAALKAIDGYDSTKSASMFTHVVCKLQYEVPNIRERQKPLGMTGAKSTRHISIVYLDRDPVDGYPAEIPIEAPFDIVEITEDVISKLSVCERDAVKAKMAGYSLRKKEQLTALSSAQDKFADYYCTVQSQMAAL